jgi:chemotaxis protein MotB
MSGRGRKRKKHEEENQERWLLTYADMITLLVAFFMMMYSMSVLNLEKFKQAAIGIRSGFNGEALKENQAGESIIEKGSAPAVAPELPKVLALPEKKSDESGNRARQLKQQREERQTLRAKRIGELTEKINQRLASLTGATHSTRVLPEAKGVAIELVGDLVFFPRGSAELSADAKKILGAVANVLSDVPNEISAEGHANSAPPSGSWELSTTRATKVVKFLLQAGKIDPRRVSVTGYGEYRPLAGKNLATIPPKHSANDLVRIFIYQD